jgi:uncharacterized protein (DUF1778 family)
VSNADNASPSPATSSCRYRIEIKVTEEQKDLIKRAAAARKLGMSEFVRNCAEKAAREILGGK